MATSPTATFGCGVPYPRTYVAFAFQAFKRRVYGTDCDFTAGARFNLASDRGAVGVAAEPEQRQQNELFEFAERCSHEAHIVHNVDYISRIMLTNVRIAKISRASLLSPARGEALIDRNPLLSLD